MSTVRLFGIPAAKARVVGIIRRGPSAWCQVSRWRPDQAEVEAGAWIRGKIFPQRADVSPCGDWLVCVIHKAGGREDWRETDCWENLSRLPWLKAHRVEASAVHQRGCRFIKGGQQPLLEPRTPNQFAVERERGWVETASTAKRATGGALDEERSVTMVKTRPTGGRQRLFVRGAFAAFRAFDADPSEAVYMISPGGPLPGVQWADWDSSGRLLVATFAGELQIWSGPTLCERVTHADLSQDRPAPGPAPAWAHPDSGG
ncbi:MAG: hypothetical protein AB8H79_14000 [Myxococcota bacterium]